MRLSITRYHRPITPSSISIILPRFKPRGLFPSEEANGDVPLAGIAKMTHLPKSD